jgi:drug/metabolite transporter (DMT)-like permease
VVVVLAVVLAGVSFVINRLLLCIIGSQAIISYGPVMEEVIKTLPGYYLGVNIIGIHVVFGMLEGLYDWYQCTGKWKAMLAAFFSVFGHSLFAVVTVEIFHLLGNIWLALAGGILAHLLWNAGMIRVNDRRRKLPE